MPLLIIAAVLVGAGIGFTVGMIAGGRIAGGKVVKVEAPYAYVEGGNRGCSGAMKQLGIALIGTVIGGGLGALCGGMLAVVSSQ